MPSLMNIQTRLNKQPNMNVARLETNKTAVTCFSVVR